LKQTVLEIENETQPRGKRGEKLLLETMQQDDGQNTTKDHQADDEGLVLFLENPHSGYVNWIQELSDGTIATCSDDRTFKVWKGGSDSECLFVYSHSSEVKRFLELDDRLVALGDSNGLVHVISLDDVNYCLVRGVKGVNTGKEGSGVSINVFSDSNVKIDEGSHPDNSVFTLQGSHSGLYRNINCMIRTTNTNVNNKKDDDDTTYIMTGSADSTIKVWNVDEGICIQTLEGHEDVIYSLCELQRDGSIVSGSVDETLIIWKKKKEKTQNQNNNTNSNDNNDNNEIGYELECRLEGHTDAVSCVIELKSTGLIASSSYDNTIRLWDRESRSCVQVLTGHTHWIHSIVELVEVEKSTSSLIVSYSQDQTIRVWSAKPSSSSDTAAVATGESLKSIKTSTDGSSLVRLKDGRLLFGGGWSKSIFSCRPGLLVVD